MNPRGPEFFAAFLAMDDTLERAGVPPLSPKWRAELRRFYLHPTATIHAGRMGRGSAKSTAISKCQTAEVNLCDWDVPPGERHWAVNVSENVDEARARLGQIGKYLEILGVPHEKAGDQILLVDRPLGFWSRAARIGAVSGPRVVSYASDEAAKQCDERGANPCEEIMISLAAASVTHPGARGRLYSSPWGASGYHHKVITTGDTSSTVVSTGPTWEFNPSISKARTHELAPDERTWTREYLAQPSQTAYAAFDANFVAAAMKPRTPERRGQRVLCVDPSSGRSDAWTWMIVGMASDAARREHWIHVDAVDGVSGSFWANLSAEKLVERIAKLCKDEGIQTVHSDQREAYGLASLFQKAGLGFLSHTWTSVSKIDACEKVRRWLREGAIALPAHEKLRNELIAFEEKLTPSGSLTFGARGSGTDDYVALLITLAHFELQCIGNAEQAAIWGQPIDGGRWADSPGRGF